MTNPAPESSFTAFSGFQRVAAGTRTDLIARLRAHSDAAQLLVFDDATGERLDIDLRDPAAPAIGTDAVETPPAARGVGRPRLGVVAREVTLLPRHWDWLGRQPGGASVALRKLIDEGRRLHVERDAQRVAREATYRFMTVIAGDLPGFEEATRALFAGDPARFDDLVAPWPDDVRDHLHKLAQAAWSAA